MGWEYLIVPPDIDYVPEAVMNDYSKKGWELVSVDNGIAYFKRPGGGIIPTEAAKKFVVGEYGTISISVNTKPKE